MEAITCPGCRRPIRVPPEVLGQRAQCPFCKAHFEAPVRAPEGLTEPRLLRRNPLAASRTFAPGMLLVFVGLLGVLINSMAVAKAYSDPEVFAEQTRQWFENAKLPNAEFTVRWMPVARVGFLALSLLVTAGGIAAAAQRYHGLALLGSVGAMFDAADCCCLIGFPVGGWALFVLLDPNVRAQFLRPPGAAIPPAV